MERASERAREQAREEGRKKERARREHGEWRGNEGGRECMEVEKGSEQGSGGRESETNEMRAREPEEDRVSEG